MSLLDEVLSQLEAMPADKITQLEKEVEGLQQIWKPLPGPQMDAYFSEADEVFYGGSAGGGKGLVKTARILTPFGWKEISSLKVGSKVCTTDGQVQRIIAYYDRGVQPLYKLTWSDGTTTVCDEDHIWLCWLSGKSRKMANKKINGEESASKRTAKEIYEHCQVERKRKVRVGIPVISKPVVFNVHGENRGQHKHISRVIPPYVLGVLLGDGYISGNSVGFSSADDEIPERVQDLVSGMYGSPVELIVYDYGNKCISYRIPNGACLEHINDLGLLGKRAETKFIPPIYLLASEEERWELLRGLMDTDGWAEEDGDCYFTTVSSRLAEDVQHLARSLGAIVQRRQKTPTYTHDGESREEQLAYTLRIKMPGPERMFFLDRKRALCAGKEPQSMGLWLESIEPYGEDETVCIAVSHPNSLYITDDFIVTHNTDLGVGLSLTAHQRSLMLRRTNKEAGKLVERYVEVLGTRTGWNGQDNCWKLQDGRVIDIGGVQHEDDKQKFKGTPHDMIFYDEISDFTETQFRFLNTWNRSTDPNQRCRVVAAGNPPTRPEGLWVVKYWAPWLDPTHTNPAQPGELRWFTTIDGVDQEVDGKGPHYVGGEKIEARSRTFIPAALSDNPFLERTGYRATLAALPTPLRKAYLEGEFRAALDDADWQIIPTSWVMDAQDRWEKDGFRGFGMTAIGYDPAGGGADEAAMIARHDKWFAEPKTLSGEDAADGSTSAAQILKYRRDRAAVIVDVGGGYGGAVTLRLKDNGVHYSGFNGARESGHRTKDNQLEFHNKRAEAWWRFAEALDPDQPGGSDIALPPDPELRADLCAPTYTVGPRGILVESKDDLRKRLGRSTNKGDACVMCWSEGEQAVRKQANRMGAMQMPSFAQMGSGPLQRFRDQKRRKRSNSRSGKPRG